MCPQIAAAASGFDNNQNTNGKQQQTLTAKCVGGVRGVGDVGRGFQGAGLAWQSENCCLELEALSACSRPHRTASHTNCFQFNANFNRKAL